MAKAKVDLLTEARALSDQPVVRAKCTFRKFMLLNMKPAQRRQIYAALEDANVSSKAIAEVLQKRGFRNTYYVVQRHRGGYAKTCQHCRIMGLPL